MVIHVTNARIPLELKFVAVRMRKDDMAVNVWRIFYFKISYLKIVLPAYTSFGHGQNFVQKGWDNGKFSHGPDDERIGSIIFLLLYSYLYKKEMRE